VRSPATTLQCHVDWPLNFERSGLDKLLLDSEGYYKRNLVVFGSEHGLSCTNKHFLVVAIDSEDGFVVLRHAGVVSLCHSDLVRKRAIDFTHVQLLRLSRSIRERQGHFIKEVHVH